MADTSAGPASRSTDTRKRRTSSASDGDEDGPSAVFLTSPVGHTTTRPSKRVLRGKCRSVDDYEKLGRLGEGTYGIVYRAKDNRSGDIVAVKRIKMHHEMGGMPVSSLREIELLRRARGHPNIVELLDVVVGRKLTAVFLTMEYCEHDMAALIDHMPVPFLEAQVKCLILQLLEGIEWLHGLSIIHRDIKMSNLLLNSRGVLKIADFGMARTVGTQEVGRSVRGDLSPRVITLWYRAPEVLFGDPLYGIAVDIWAVGCIFGELLLHKPLLPGKNEEHQIDLLVRMFGTPHDSIWPGFSALPHASRYRLLDQPYDNLRETLPFQKQGCIDLMHKLFVYDPTQRISAGAARLHYYFSTSPLPTDVEDMPTFPQFRQH